VPSLEELFEEFRAFLPKYLTPSQKRELFDSLSVYPNLPYHYLPPSAINEELLQGDGWRGFVLVNFATLEKKSVSGMILSNSCDIDARNRRATPRNILFGPLVSVKKYEEAMRQGGLTPEQTADALRDIRAQKVTYIYYLPSGQYGPQESLMILDDIHPEPLAHFSANERALLFRLSQPAFYILLIKLSIHFCRSQENVQRFPPAQRVSVT
jgi:hypothetical protein